MEGELRYIIEKTGCTLKEAETLYDITKDAEEAVVLYKSIKETEYIHIIKGRFSAKEIFGLFIIHALAKEGRLKKTIALFSSSPTSIYDVESSWDVFEQDLQNALKQHTKIDAKNTRKLNKLLRKVASSASFFNALNFSDKEYLTHYLKEEIEKFSKKSLDLKLAIEEIPIFPHRTKEVTPLRMRGNLVLSPVSGKKVEELKEGEKVLLQIKDEELSSIFGKSPVFAPIKKIKRIQDKVHVLMDLGPQIEAEAVLPPNVRIRSVEEKKEVFYERIQKPLYIIIISLIIILLLHLLLR